LAQTKKQKKNAWGGGASWGGGWPGTATEMNGGGGNPDNRSGGKCRAFGLRTASLHERTGMKGFGWGHPASTKLNTGWGSHAKKGQGDPHGRKKSFDGWVNEGGGKKGKKRREKKGFG